MWGTSTLKRLSESMEPPYFWEAMSKTATTKALSEEIESTHKKFNMNELFPEAFESNYNFHIL